MKFEENQGLGLNGGNVRDCYAQFCSISRLLIWCASRNKRW
jgi:hypothetical protein